MTANQLRARGWSRRLGRLAAGTVVATGLLGASAAGCLDRPIQPVEPRTTSTIVERLTQSSVDKIDLLLAIDNSRSMADKQEILALAIPDLVRGLVNPKCLDENGQPVAPGDQPQSPTEDCPAGTKREFQPVVDIHIGIISSSIGGHGSDACPDVEPADKCTPPGGGDNYTNNDKGHLLSRKDPYGGANVPTYQDKGFLAWDPTQRLDPPGETVIGGVEDPPGSPGIVPALRDMVKGVGQIGCGFESQLESWYRFLVDPEPYETIGVVEGKISVDGIDKTIIAQRADFLRPDSLLAIIMLTDENDCSIRETGQFYFAAQGVETPFHLPPARSECKTNPNDKCCASCGQKTPDGCPPDPACEKAALDEIDDKINLRCFDQKRRFGIDFLYPVDRYVKALTSVTVPNRAGEMVPNPIFSDLNPNDENTTVRDAGLVFFAGIVGVPWQDIARNPTNLLPGFKSAEELLEKDENGLDTWDIILGKPEEYVPPKDPLMIESIDPRTGSNPITGDDMVTAADPLGNPINGHEWTVADRGDLQYACIFPLLEGSERDCTEECHASCDCISKTNDNPLCEPNPNDDNKPTRQVRAKAYPGIRHLSVLKALGSQGIVGSVCPAQLDTPEAPDYGYRPAIGAIIDRLKVALGGQCLPRTLTPNSQGQVPCLIIEARRTEGKGKCLEKDARREVAPEQQAAVEAAKADPINEVAKWDTFCEVIQVEGAAREACQNDLNNPPVTKDGKQVDGWCYIDATTTPPTGDPAIVEKCPETDKRLIRFVGKGEAQPGATLFITCSGE